MPHPSHSHLASQLASPKLFSMVSTFRSREYTDYALNSFFEATSLADVDRIVLINNDDPELTLKIPEIHRARLEVINNTKPQSFAANANMMIDLAVATKSDLFFINNDVIFSDNWLTPFIENQDSILLPVSNREVQYLGSAVVIASQHIATSMILKAPMDLAQYLESPRMFQAIAEAHQKTATGFLPLIVSPFFCVRLPLKVLCAVGKFDCSFGPAGGEDYDYALRAWLAGYKVQLALASYLLHFWGKSTWTNSGESAQTQSYDTGFLKRFEDKWGSPLYRYVLQENDEDVRADPELLALRESGDIASIVSRLMKDSVDIYLP